MGRLETAFLCIVASRPAAQPGEQTAKAMLRDSSAGRSLPSMDDGGSGEDAQVA